ncbi:MAG: DUF2330 domain-containing protein [Polyangiales bacterium]
MNRFVWSLVAMLSVLCSAPLAHAFCGFYVSGADASLYNSATMVVLMRDGTRTVLSIQNNYQGPPEDFALVVPVPVVLQKENVKTLPKSIFERVDKLGAPRLVEYWEQDPCNLPMMMEASAAGGMRRTMMFKGANAVADADYGVKIEAQFKVAEYDILILSAKDSNGLDLWLRKEKYNIPKGAETVLRGYVTQGTKFFVAKVDAKKVKFENGNAVLSPLRFHYDDKNFQLPVRLGLLNSKGTQDLIVNILAKNQRYEVANYKNATVPTNIRVENSVRENFGQFYNTLFDRVRKENGNAVITEYSWDATSCDPCPEPPLTLDELATLGADVLLDAQPGENSKYEDIPGVVKQGTSPRRPIMWPQPGFVLTRLHYRYTKDELGEDLVFKTAPPIFGGRGMPDQNGNLEERRAIFQQGSINNFQGRYVMLNRWEGKIECDSPQRGMWGGPPDEQTVRPVTPKYQLQPGDPLPPSKRSLESMIQTPIPELKLVPKPEEKTMPEMPARPTRKQTIPRRPPRRTVVKG